MSDKPSFVYVIYIASTAEKIYDAIQDPELTKLFWGRHKNVSDWKPGSRWEHQDYDDGTVDQSGEILEAERPHRLVMTWEGSPKFRVSPTRVTFLIEPAFGMVRLTVTHADLEPGSPMEKGVTSGWPAILSSLKTLLETGKPLDATTRRWKGPPQ